MTYHIPALLPVSQELLEDGPSIFMSLQDLMSDKLTAYQDMLVRSYMPKPRPVYVVAMNQQRADSWAHEVGLDRSQYRFVYDARVAMGYAGRIFVVEPLGHDKRMQMWREYLDVMENQGCEVVYFVQ